MGIFGRRKGNEGDAQPAAMDESLTMFTQAEAGRLPGVARFGSADMPELRE